MKVEAFRLCPKVLAQAGSAFRGEGARLAGGRWNPPGIAVVYAAGSLSLASLELLVHFETQSDLPELVFYRVQFADGLVETLDPLPPDWRVTPAPLSTQQAGAEWHQRERTPVLRVPSAVVPTEWNFVLNPSHQDFRRITIEGPHDFAMDPRLIRS